MSHVIRDISQVVFHILIVICTVRDYHIALTQWIVLSISENFVG